MKEVTAVQFLIQNILEDQTIKAKSMSEWIMVFEKVKEMEKQQIIDAFENGEDNIDSDGCSIDRNGAEQYYNETYKSE
jgi:hypothetical protein